MNKYSFEIKNSIDFLNKLKLDVEDFRKDILSSRLAINCALTAWHLTDWVFSEYKTILPYNNKGAFRESLNCKSLFIMHDIANGCKHFELTRPKSQINDTDLHIGGFSRDFSFDFDISCLTILMESGEIKYFEEELKNVLDFWEIYFQDTLGVNNLP